MIRTKNGKIIIILLGDKEVGKTSILTQFSKQKFPNYYVSIIGVDFYTKKVKIENNEINYCLWDTNGEEIENQILPLHIYQNANAFLLVCSYDSLESCRKIPYYLNFIQPYLIRKNSKLDNINDKIPVYILINKKDIKDKFFIKENVCSFFKDDLNYVNVIETSARDNNNINNLFIQISKKILGINFIENNDFESSNNMNNNSIINLEQGKNKKCKKCC